MSGPDNTISNAEGLYRLGYMTVPLCRGHEDGTCTAEWHDHPCQSRGKRPLIAGYGQLAEVRPNTGQFPDLAAQIMHFWPCNLGIIVPPGLIVVDADSPAAEDEIIALSAGVHDHAPTRERRPTRGRAWLFQQDPSNPIDFQVHRGASRAIDLLTTGRIFVVPPSWHWRGYAYSWVPSHSPWDRTPPVLPPAVQQLARPTQSRTSARVTPGSFSPRISSRVQFLMNSHYKFKRLWEGNKDFGDTSASGVDFEIARWLLKQNVSDREVAEAIAARPGAHRHEEDYCLKTVFNAKRREK